VPQTTWQTAGKPQKANTRSAETSGIMRLFLGSGSPTGLCSSLVVTILTGPYPRNSDPGMLLRAISFRALSPNHFERRPIREAIDVEVSIQCKDPPQSEALCHSNHRCIGKIHWRIVVLLHQYSHALQFARGEVV
jgi:hypothetical protein